MKNSMISVKSSFFPGLESGLNTVYRVEVWDWNKRRNSVRFYINQRVGSTGSLHFTRLKHVKGDSLNRAEVMCIAASAEKKLWAAGIRIKGNHIAGFKVEAQQALF